MYLGLLENPELIDVENHPYVVIVRHITSRQFAFYLTETKSDPREHDIEIVSWLDKTLNNYKTTGDRFCKVRSGRHATTREMEICGGLYSVQKSMKIKRIQFFDTYRL